MVFAAQAAGDTTVGRIIATPADSGIWISAYYSDSDNNNSLSISWKLSTDSVWPATPQYTLPNTPSPYTLKITGLTNGTSYDVRVVFIDSSVTGSNPADFIGIVPSTLMHNSENTTLNEMKWQPEGWGIPRGKYGQFECGTCHQRVAQNIKRIKGIITAPSGTFPGSVDGSVVSFQSLSDFGDDSGGRTTSNRICEFCHSQTSYHRYDATGQTDTSHNNKSDCTMCHKHSGGFAHGKGSSGGGCIECHGHDAGYEYEPGKFSQGRGTAQSHSTHTENDGYDIRGPNITCDTCHDTANFPYFRSGTDTNGDGRYNLAETDVCNTCHSPGGSYNAVNSENGSVGAKDNWHTGVYAGSTLQTGKELWCVGCHDEVPSNSKPDGSGVPARNVAGDNATYGFYKTGHGRASVQCLTCHDSRKKHIDHEYTMILDLLLGTSPNPTNYRFYDGKEVEMPQSSDYEADDHALCITCHEESWITDNSQPKSGVETNFKSPYYDLNLHYYHAYQYKVSCVFCHEPHGDPRARMTSLSRMGDFRILTLNPGDGKYYELSDSSKWNDPAYNYGGVLASNPACFYRCHSSQTPAAIAAGLGPNEQLGDGWYLRTYKTHTYTVNSDTDNDGIGDYIDVCLAVADPGQLDRDNDGFGDACDNCPTVYNPGQKDSDGDNVGDACDICSSDPNNDADGDGFCGNMDNCPAVFNTDQTDSDGDGFGNACDNCSSVFNSNQFDADGDGIGDVCDSCPNDSGNDGDGDGVCGNIDNCSTIANPDQLDSDGDGIGDVCDICPSDQHNDADNDGFCIGAGFMDPKTGDQDNCSLDANSDQTDSDGDGVGDACDNCVSTANSTQVDTNHDGVGDACGAVWSQTTDSDFSQGTFLSDTEVLSGNVVLTSAGDIRVSDPKLTAGSNHICGLSRSGHVYCWGNNSYGQLGTGVCGSSSNPAPVHVVKGSAVEGDNDGTYLSNMRDIAGGNYSSCAVSNGGNVYCWGMGSEIASGSFLSGCYAPSRVVAGQAAAGDSSGGYLSNIKSINSQGAHYCAISNAGNVYCWGNNLYAELGAGYSGNTAYSPLRVVAGDALSGDRTSDGYLTNIRDAATITYATCVVSGNNNVYCWGNNTSGQIGQGYVTTTAWTPVLKPKRVIAGEAPSEDSTTDGYLGNIKEITGDRGNSFCAVSNSTYAYCWGQNWNGSFGNGVISGISSSPVRVLKGVSPVGSKYLSGVDTLDTGLYVSCAAAQGDLPYCWGSNYDYELGDGQSCGTMCSTPVRVLKGNALTGNHDGTYLANIKDTANIDRENCGLSVNGYVYCWGTLSGSILPQNYQGLNLDIPRSYAATGTYVSTVHDTTAGSDFMEVSWTDTLPTGTGIVIKVRTSNDAGMSGATDWSACDPVAKNTDLSSNNCVTDGDRYVQYYAALSTSDTAATPYLGSISIKYLPGGAALSTAIINPARSASLNYSAPDPYVIRGVVTGSPGMSVEVSTDNGSTWNPALCSGCTGSNAAWTYDWTLPADGYYTIRSRATDTLNNMETPAAGNAIYVHRAAPQVSSTTPADGTTGYNGSYLYINWNDDIDCSTVNTGNITINKGQWSDSAYLCSGTAARFGISGIYGSNTYRVTVSKGVMNMLGTPMAGDYSFSFTSYADTAKPTVTAFAAPSESYSLYVPITSFTGSDGTQTAGYAITTTPTPPAPSDPVWSATAPATFAVPADGTYTLYPWVKDRANGPTSGNVSDVSSLHPVVVVNTASPAVTGTAPANGAGNVALNGNVTITWNKDIDCSTVSTSTIVITTGGWTMSNCSGNQAVFTPSVQSASTLYSVTVKTAVKDTGGNPMLDDYQFTYETGAM